MSNSRRPEREWRFYLKDMIGFARRVQDYTEGLDQSVFIADRRTYDAHLAQSGTDWRSCNESS